MSPFQQHKNAKQLWIVTALLLVLLACIGVLVFLLSDKPAGPAPVESSNITSSAESSSEEESSEPESSSEPEESTVAPPSSSKPTSTVRPPSSSSSTPAQTTQQSLVISKSGTYDDKGTYSSVTIDASNVTLKSTTVKGNLTIKSGADNVKLQNVVVTGKIYLEADD